MEFSVTRRVAFSETDASGRVHFTQILKWVEEAEHRALSEAGVPVFAPDTGWPRVNVECKYLLPLTFDEEVFVIVTLSKIGESSLVWDFEIQKSTKEMAAHGTFVTVYVKGEGSAKIPAEIRSSLGQLLN